MRRKKINIKARINKDRKWRKMNEPKSCFIEIINKVDKPLSKLIKTYITYIRNKRKNIITDHTDIKKYYE